MKLQMMILSQLPLFLRFSVRMLCCSMFFIVVFMSSQTPFSYSDSTLFISDDSYLYIESPVDMSTESSLSGKNNTLKQVNTSQHKAFKPKSSSISNNVNKLNQACFTIPKSLQCVINSSNSLSTAILGSSSPIKKDHKMIDPALRVFLNINLLEKKLLYPFINHLNLLKITTNHFSRPPPLLVLFC